MAKRKTKKKIKKLKKSKRKIKKSKKNKRRRKIIRAKNSKSNELIFKVPNNVFLIGCYHPSPRNVNTGRINEKKMTNLFLKVLKLV